MDPQLTTSYHGPQRAPVFGQSPAPSAQPNRPLWALLIYASIVGFLIVGGLIEILGRVS